MHLIIQERNNDTKWNRNHRLRTLYLSTGQDRTYSIDITLEMEDYEEYKHSSKT